MAEWSIAAVLKTVELRGSGGSNPSLSAKKKKESMMVPSFLFWRRHRAFSTHGRGLLSQQASNDTRKLSSFKVWAASKKITIQNKKIVPEMDTIFLLRKNSCSYYSAATSAEVSTTGASAFGAAFLPARRVVFLAAALGVLSMFSL